MTNEEAIEILKHEHDYAQLLSYVNEALKMAISALEKQTPKKVKDKYRDIVSIGKCPVCERQCDTTMNYCMKCGQALDWEDDKLN